MFGQVTCLLNRFCENVAEAAFFRKVNFKHFTEISDFRKVSLSIRTSNFIFGNCLFESVMLQLYIVKLKGKLGGYNNVG